jgi:hypothetical protein
MTSCFELDRIESDDHVQPRCTLPGRPPGNSALNAGLLRCSTMTAPGARLGSRTPSRSRAASSATAASRTLYDVHHNLHLTPSSPQEFRTIHPIPIPTNSANSSKHRVCIRFRFPAPPPIKRASDRRTFLNPGRLPGAVCTVPRPGRCRLDSSACTRSAKVAGERGAVGRRRVATSGRYRQQEGSAATHPERPCYVPERASCLKR